MSPSVIKIDVEGAEPFVLEGADNVLKAQPIVIFEMGVSKKPARTSCRVARPRLCALFRGYSSLPRGLRHRLTTVVNTESRALRNSIISFNDAAAENLAPFLVECDGGHSHKTCAAPGGPAHRDAGGSLAALCRSEKIPGGKDQTHGPAHVHSARAGRSLSRGLSWPSETWPTAFCDRHLRQISIGTGWSRPPSLICCAMIMACSMQSSKSRP